MRDGIDRRSILEAITPGEEMTEESPQEPPAQYHFRKFMEHLGLDVSGEHMERTPERVYKAYRDELFRGLDEDPEEHLERTFTSPKSGSEPKQVDEEASDAGFIIQDGIHVKSLCAHHFLPFQGQAHVGYIPTDKIVGLSKLARVVDGYARRPQVQERLGNQVADAIHDVLDPIATVVVIEAKHECMSMRGVMEPDSMTRTSALRGKARTDEHIKHEFFDLVGETR